MIESVIVYAIVAGAAGWTLWRLGARRWFKRPAAARNEARCGPDCGCGK